MCDKRAVTQAIRKATLEQYNAAIGCIRTLSNTSDKGKALVVLTCCAVFITLENMLGRYSEALRHIKAGSSLLALLLREQSNSGAPDEFLDDFSAALCRLSDDVWGYIREMLAPDLNIYTARYGSQPQRTHFVSVDEAEQSLHDITKSVEADTSVIQRKVHAYAQYGYSQSHRRFMPAQECPCPGTTSFASLKTRFQNWSEVFSLFRAGLDPLHTPQKDLLRIQTLAVDQALWTGWFNCSEWRDYREDDLIRIVQEAELLVQQEGFIRSPVFAFDGSLILDIAMACVCSASSGTQQRCIALLRSFHRREGIWDSQEIADILEAVTIATEGGIVTKDVLPWDVPHLARMMDALSLANVHIPLAPLLLAT
jgi:hypothetical protein